MKQVLILAEYDLIRSRFLSFVSPSRALFKIIGFLAYVCFLMLVSDNGASVPSLIGYDPSSTRSMEIGSWSVLTILTCRSSDSSDAPTSDNPTIRLGVDLTDRMNLLGTALNDYTLCTRLLFLGFSLVSLVSGAPPFGSLCLSG